MNMPRRLSLLIGLLIPFALLAVTQDDVVGYWKLELSPGFNLVAFPVLPQNPTVRNVIGDRLGSVEISTFDPQLNRYRAAYYDAGAGTWTGDLYILSRGTAFWINLLDNQPRELFLSGFPEKYTRFHWNSLGEGWRFYAPVYGKEQKLSDVPPENPDDVVIRWNPARTRFEMTPTDGGSAWFATSFDNLDPDQAYYVDLHNKLPERFGPPTQLESAAYSPVIDIPEGGGARVEPPFPMILGNKEGIAICHQNGEVCSGGMTVQIYKEVATQQPGGEWVSTSVLMDEQNVASALSTDGKFKIVTTINGGSGLKVGDRIHLTVIGQKGAKTSSVSFEIPAEVHALLDLKFGNPMTAPNFPATIPTQFSMTAPYPNPFNSSFRVDFETPVTGLTLLRLYDLNGRTVKEERLPLAAGIHRITFSGNGLANGLYFFEVSSGGHKAFAKVAYVK